MTPGLSLLNDDIFESFPEVVQLSGDPEWRVFADKLNFYRDEALRLGNSIDGSLSIEQLDDIFKCERIPTALLFRVGSMLDARIATTMTEREVRQKICAAIFENRRHATLAQLKDLIFEITGFVPDVTIATAGNVGWDELNTIHPPTYFVEMYDGILWDETNAYDSLAPEQFLWTPSEVQLLIDIKNGGAYTADQLNAIYRLVAELKPAEKMARVGYVSMGSFVTLKYIFSEDI